MDIKFINDKNRFLYRVSVIIFNKELNKILLFNVENRDWYMLTGGKVQFGETSETAIKREVKEELGYELDNLFLAAVSEEYADAKGYHNHQLNLIYRGVFNGEIIDTSFNGLDGDWTTYKWINVEDLEKYSIFPEGIKQIIQGQNTLYHIIAKNEKDVE